MYIYIYIYIYVLYIYCIWYVSFLHLFGGCYDSTMMGFPRIITPPTEMHRCGVRGLMAEGVRRGWDGCHYQNWKYSGQQGGSNKTADGQPTIIASKYPLDMEGCCFNIPQIATEINWVQGFDPSTHPDCQLSAPKQRGDRRAAEIRAPVVMRAAILLSSFTK